MTFNKCSVNGKIYGDLMEYGAGDEVIIFLKLIFVLLTASLYETGIYKIPHYL